MRKTEHHFIWGFMVDHPAIGDLGKAGFGVHVATDSFMEAISRDGGTRYIVCDHGGEDWVLYRHDGPKCSFDEPVLVRKGTEATKGTKG